MQRKETKPKQKYKRRKFHPSKRMYREVQQIATLYDSEMLAFGENAVAVKGDDREHGPAVIIRVPTGIPHELVGEISTRITNEVRGVTRVLISVEPLWSEE